VRGPAVPADEAEQRALRQAYYFANLEFVRRIRTFAPGVIEAAVPGPARRTDSCATESRGAR